MHTIISACHAGSEVEQRKESRKVIKNSKKSGKVKKFSPQHSTLAKTWAMNMTFWTEGVDGTEMSMS